MTKFWELVQESVIVQGILTLGVTAAVFGLIFSTIEVPPEVWTLLGLAWGFYFGGKTQLAIQGWERKSKDNGSVHDQAD